MPRTPNYYYGFHLMRNILLHSDFRMPREEHEYPKIKTHNNVVRRRGGQYRNENSRTFDLMQPTVSNSKYLLWKLENTREKRKDKKLKWELSIDTWSILDLYFRDSPYYKSQHHLDSYDEFIYSKTNGIQHIITRGNPFRIYKESLNTGSNDYKYEMEIYFGETLKEDTPAVPIWSKFST